MVEATSQRKYIVGGNWKSNGTIEFVRDMCSKTLNTMQYDQEKVQVVITPVALHIAAMKTLLNKDVEVGTQNISATKNGAFTGELSADQVKDFELKWTLIGHSERRQKQGETNEIVAEKVKQAQEVGLNTIVCIGETLEDREAGKTNDVLKEQLEAFKGSVTNWESVVLAYEPVWAIGTGKTATPAIAQDAHAYIRGWLAENVNDDVANATRI
jgi:triosephosphate isomerase